jgi:hypothetical protein
MLHIRLANRALLIYLEIGSARPANVGFLHDMCRDAFTQKHTHAEGEDERVKTRPRRVQGERAHALTAKHITAASGERERQASRN